MQNPPSPSPSPRQMPSSHKQFTQRTWHWAPVGLHGNQPARLQQSPPRQSNFGLSFGHCCPSSVGFAGAARSEVNPPAGLLVEKEGRWVRVAVVGVQPRPFSAIPSIFAHFRPKKGDTSRAFVCCHVSMQQQVAGVCCACWAQQNAMERKLCGIVCLFRKVATF